MLAYDKVSNYTQIPTYEILIELVQSFLNRFDEETVNTIPLFINMAEKTILRNLRVPAMERVIGFRWGDIAGAEGKKEGYIYLPTDYLEMINIWRDDTDTPFNFERVAFTDLVTFHSDTTPTTNPTSSAVNPTTEDTYSTGCGGFGGFGSAKSQHANAAFARMGNKWYFRPVPSEDDYIKINYYADPRELAEAGQGTSTKLLELLPDAILYEAVAEGFRFLHEEDKATYYNRLAMERVEQVQLQSDEAEYSGSPLQIHGMGG